MRVVCDNCGAVYKIANEKLSKEVNRATCKRCGHKIIIYKPGSRAAEEAAASQTSPVTDEEDEERTVIKSVPELQKMASSQASVPSIGSLTAELRAISIPGIQSVGGPTPKADALGPLGPSGPTDSTPPPPPPAIAPLPSQSAAGPGVQPSSPRMPAMIPATAIPASDSPATKVYDGPSPSVAGAPSPAGSTAPLPPPFGTPAPAPATDQTRPMPLPTTGRTAPVPSNGSTGPTLGTSPSPAPTIGGPVPARTAPMGSATAVTTVKASASPVLGAVTWFSIVGLVGLLGSLAGLDWPVSLIFFALAALGLTACLFLATVTSRGRHPQRTPIALILAFFLTVVLTAIHFAVAGGLVSGTTNAPTPADLRPPPEVKPVPVPTPAVAPEATEPSEDGATGAGLDSEELEMARKYSGAEVAGLGNGKDDAWRDPTPAKESKADVVRPPPVERRTPRPQAEPTPAPRETSAPGPSRPRLNEPDPSSGSGKTDGPSPFVIDTIIRNNASIVRCLRVEEAKGVDLSGKIYLKFTIAPEGGVSKARVTTSRFAGTALDTCISRELDSLKFPPFEGTPKKITYPLIVQ